MLKSGQFILNRPHELLARHLRNWFALEHVPVPIENSHERATDEQALGSGKVIITPRSVMVSSDPAKSRVSKGRTTSPAV
jgi:hypothetical protein